MAKAKGGKGKGPKMSEATKQYLRSLKGNKRGATPAPPKRSESRNVGGKAKAVAHGLIAKASEALGTPVRPLQMIMSGGFGAIFDKFLDRVGAAELVRFATGGKVQPLFDWYWNNNVGNIQARSGQFQDSANFVLAQWAMGAAGAKVIYDGASKGKFDGKDVNFLGPFALGAYFFDAPEGEASRPMGAGALSGISGSKSGTSPADGCGWV
jgi:hypothetical protein